MTRSYAHDGTNCHRVITALPAALTITHRPPLRV
jgi:hypothetical protein